MKRYLILILAAVFLLTAETLFQVKDSQDRVVLDVSTDGLRVYNEGDLLMEISSSDIRAFIENDPSKGLARSFSVTTSSNVKNETNVLEITTDATQLREGDQGQQYTDFSPDNIFLGLKAGISTTPGSPSTFSGKTNIFLGNESGINNTSGGYNILIGDKAGFNNTSGGSNMFIGNNSGETNSTGGWNLFVGHGSGKNNTATNNLFVGHNAGYTNSTGYANLFLGTDAGAYNTGGSRNVFVGQQTGVYNTVGDNNTFVGRSAGNANQLYSDDNTYIGSSAGLSQTTGNQNTYIGSNAGQSKSGGSYNTFAGFGAGQNNASGGHNSFYGYHAGYNNTGYYNTFLGMQSGYSNTGNSNVFVGYRSGYNETASNKLYIANSTTATPLIKGTFPNTDLTFKATTITADGNLTVTGNSTVNGNSSVIGTATSTGLLSTGNHLRITNNPGTDTSPAYYAYQGITGSTGKRYAFAINDALWVTSNAWIDGTMNSKGIEASVDEKSGLAANFKGDVNVAGAVSRSSDKIVIDHPLDPESKYFKYSGVNSDQMSNIFHGNAILDRDGKAVVDLPNWFENINSDFRYQLTAIGAPGPNLYISEKINGNSFGIAGGTPDMEVSWQIIALRTDNYAKAYPIRNETEKKDYEKGYYLHPEAYSLPVERGIDYKNKIRMREKEIAE